MFEVSGQTRITLFSSTAQITYTKVSRAAGSDMYQMLLTDYRIPSCPSITFLGCPKYKNVLKVWFSPLFYMLSHFCLNAYVSLALLMLCTCVSLLVNAIIVYHFSISYKERLARAICAVHMSLPRGITYCVLANFLIRLLSYRFRFIALSHAFYSSRCQHPVF